MQKSLRLKRLKDYVRKHKDVTITDLQSVIDASESTIRRDIKALAQEGFLHEHYGSVTLIETKPVDILLTKRLEAELTAKQHIGSLAATYVKSNGFIYIDAGSTTYYMIKHLQNRAVTVVTNGINIAIECNKYDLETILIGGTLKPLTMAMVGDLALDNLRHYQFDQCFMGSNGITKEGYTTPELKEGTLKKLVIQQSKEAYILADRTKEGVLASYRFASLEDAIWLHEGVMT